MILIYQGTGPADAWLVRDLLTRHGLDVQVRDHLGCGRGQLPLVESWPSVWIATRDAEAAQAVLDASRGPHLVHPAWTCAGCGEQNTPAFDWCWRCETPAPG